MIFDRKLKTKQLVIFLVSQNQFTGDQNIPRIRIYENVL